MRTIGPNTLFSVDTRTLPTIAVDAGAEFTVEVRGAFDDVEDISAVRTPFTRACDGHPLAPIAGPIVVRGAKPGDRRGDRPDRANPVRQERCTASSGARWRSLRRCTTAAPGSAAAFRCPSTPISARSRRCRPKATSRLTPAPLPKLDSLRPIQQVGLSRGRKSIAKRAATTPSSPMSPSISTTGLNPRALRSPCLTDLLFGRSAPAVEADRADTASDVWADTAYRSAANLALLAN
jgi:hypothetical protein